MNLSSGRALIKLSSHNSYVLLHAINKYQKLDGTGLLVHKNITDATATQNLLLVLLIIWTSL